MTQPLDIDHPWPGPDSFRAEDARFFRGRENEIKQLLQLIRRARSVVLYGASGLGKTSLINAGLIPRLDRDEFFAVPIRIAYGATEPSVSSQLQAQILEHGRDHLRKAEPQPTAWELLHRRDNPIEGAQPIVIIDQFEELFTIGAHATQAVELVEELMGLIEGVPPRSVRERLEQSPDEARLFSFQRDHHRVLLSIREDFLYGLERLGPQLPSIMHNRFHIGPLSGVMAMQVVLQRAESEGEAAPPAGHSPVVDVDVAELIVRTAACVVPDQRPLETLEVEPALLSILCTELARRRAPGTPITSALVTGNRKDIISSFYERVLRDVPESVREYVENELVTETGFRTSAVLTEALTVPGFSDDVLKKLVDRRLLRVIDRSNVRWLEFTHDVLTEIATGNRKLRQARQLAQQEQQQRAVREKKLHRRVALAVSALVAGLAVLLAFYGTALHGRRQADKAKRAIRMQFIDASLREGREREALSQLAAVVDQEPDAAWARALAGDLLLRRAWPMPARRLFPPGRFTWIDCDDERDRCVATYRDGRVLVFGADGTFVHEFNTHQAGYGHALISGDGARLLFFPEQAGTAIQWRLDDPKVPEVPFELATTWEVGASPSASSDRRTVVLATERALDVWKLDTPTAKPQPTPVPLTGARVLFDLSFDGQWLAYLDLTHIRLLHVSDGTKRARPIPGDVTALGIDPASKILTVALRNGKVHRWSMPDLAEVGPPLETKRAVSSINFDSKGNQMALTLEGGGVELWSAPWRSGRPLMSSSPGIMTISFAPDDQWLAIATRSGVVSSWSSEAKRLGEPVQFDGLAFATPLRGKNLLAVSLSGVSGRWTIPTPRPPATYELGEPIREAWFETDDAFFAHGDTSQLEVAGGRQRSEPLPRSLLFTRDRTHTATIYRTEADLRTGLPSSAMLDKEDTLLLEGKTDSLSFSADGKRLAIASGGRGFLLDVNALRRPLGVLSHDVAGVWLNQDGSLMATKSYDVGLTIWRPGPDGSFKEAGHIDRYVVSWVAFDRQGDKLVMVSENKAYVWSVHDQRFVGLPVAHDAAITDAEFSSDGRWLVTAGEDRRARIWEVATDLPASDWFVHEASIITASFSPSDRKLLTASADGEIKIWPLAGTADANGQQRHWLAQAASLLSGMSINPETGVTLVAPPDVQPLESLRSEIARQCPAGTDRGECGSATVRLLRALLGPKGRTAYTAR